MTKFLSSLLNAEFGIVAALLLIGILLAVACALRLSRSYSLVAVLALVVPMLAGCSPDRSVEHEAFRHQYIADCLKECNSDTCGRCRGRRYYDAWITHQVNEDRRKREEKRWREQDKTATDSYVARKARAKCEGSEMEDAHKLHFAAKNGDLAAVRQMLDSGIDIEEKCGGEGGKTPLHMAAEGNAREIVAVLLGRGANVEARLPGVRMTKYGYCGPGVCIVPGFSQYKESYDRMSGMTALHLAAESNASDAIVEIVAHGGNVEAVNKELYTPLHYAARKNAAESVAALVNQGANLEARTDFGRNSPLHLAARENSINALTILLDSGANIEAVSTSGWSALHMAVWGKHQETAFELIKRGANINAVNEAGKTPLDIALAQEQYEIANQLQRVAQQARKTPQEKPKTEFASAKTEAGGVFETIWRSVVVVEAGNSQGSGVALKPNLVATNCHVTDAATSSIAAYKGENRRADKSKSYPARVIAGDRKRDVCILEVEGLWAIPAETRNAAEMQIAEQVYAVGAPRGLDFSISGGLVSQLREEDEEGHKLSGNAPLIQTDTAISPGSSGGGLFDAKGKLVGLTTFGYRDSEGLNFAVPIEWALELIPDAER